MSTTALRVTGPMIRALEQTSSEGALVERDGRLEVIHHLPSADLPDDGSAIVLRSSARRWAEELVALAREAAESEGTSTALNTLRAAAGRLATDELTEERRREEAVPRPRPRPVLLRRTGRHAAPVSQEQERDEWAALLDLLEALDAA